MFCSKCGSALLDNVNYCSECGEQVAIIQNKERNKNIKTNNKMNTKNKYINKLIKILEQRVNYLNNKNKKIKFNIKESNSKEWISKKDINIKQIYYSEKEILNKIREKCRSVGLYCKRKEIKVGESQTTGGGVLLGSGDVIIGGGTTEQKKKVWNPFYVKKSSTSPFAIELEIIETSNFSKEINGVTYQGRNIKIKKQKVVDMEFSGIGCLLALLPIAFFGLVAIAGAPVAILIGGLFAHILYKIGEKISKYRIKNKSSEFNEIFNKLNLALDSFNNEVSI